MNVVRRTFLQQGAATVAAGLLPGVRLPGAGQTGPGSAGTVPGRAPHLPDRGTALKFTPEGAARPFAGNTVICHLPAQCAMRDVMSALHERLLAAPFRHCLGLTTEASYHMTIYAGANDQDRRATGWPSYVPLDATMEQCNSMVADRMRRARLSCELPFRVQVDVPATLQYPLACTLRMRAVDAREEHKLREVRDRLAELYGFRMPDHDEYAFHITMAYQVAPFTPAEKAAFQALRAQFVQRLVAVQPVLELGNPEFCTFNDMQRFEPELLVSCG